jgi:hypothetical protein
VEGASTQIQKSKKSQRLRMLAVVLTGGYCWALTVLPPLGTLGFGSTAGAFALLALSSLLASPFLPPGRPALTGALDLFLGFCAVSWFLGRNQLIDPPLAVFGSFGWLAYTFALGSLSTPSDTEATDLAAGPHLDPRTNPSRFSAAVLIGCLVAALVLLGAAWKVDRPALAVLSHVFALVVVLLILRSGAHLSTYLQVRRTKLSMSPRLSPAGWPLILLALLLVVGTLWSFLPG